MTRVLPHLEERGLVARTPHPTDGRQVLVALTDSARELIAERPPPPRGMAGRRTWPTSTADDREVLRAAVPVLERLAAAR